MPPSTGVDEDGDVDARDEVQEYVLSDEDDDMGVDEPSVRTEEGEAHARGKEHGRDRKKQEKQSGSRVKGSNRKLGVNAAGKAVSYTHLTLPTKA